MVTKTKESEQEEANMRAKVAVVFEVKCSPYLPGETACFTPKKAHRLVETRGVAQYETEEGAKIVKSLKKHFGKIPRPQTKE